MTKQHTQVRFGRVSTFAAGFLLTLYSTFSASSFASSAEHNSLESTSFTAVEESLLSQAANEFSTNTSIADIAEKRELLQQSLAAANNINNPRFQQNAWADIAEVYVSIGDYEQAERRLDQVCVERVGGAESCVSSSIRAYLDRNSQLATTYAAMGDMETAEELLSPAIALISSREAMEAAKGDAITDEHIGLIRSEAIEELAKVYGNIGSEIGSASLGASGLRSLMRLVQRQRLILG